MTPTPVTSWRRVGPLDIAYDATVLEPRPWTAAQAEWAAELSTTAPPGPLLELCCGAGHIGLLTALLSGRDATLVDASESAHRFADLNAGPLRQAGFTIDIRLGSMTDVLDPAERFPLVVADPPYLPSGDTGLFPDDPLRAIDGGADGLDLARLCLDVAARHLQADGAIVLQLRDRAQVTALVAEDVTRFGLVATEVRVVADGGALVLLREPGSALARDALRE